MTPRDEMAKEIYLYAIKTCTDLDNYTPQGRKQLFTEVVTLAYEMADVFYDFVDNRE